MITESERDRKKEREEYKEFMKNNGRKGEEHKNLPCFVVDENHRTIKNDNSYHYEMGIYRVPMPEYVLFKSFVLY